MINKTCHLSESDDYKGEHSSPCPESGAPLHNLNSVYPEDFHTNPQHYSDGASYDRESTSVMQAAKGKPNMGIKIYRAVPKIMSHQEKLDKNFKERRHILKHGTIPSGVVTNLNKSQYFDKLHDENAELEKNAPTTEPEKLKINKGDWVTASRSYAKDHGEANLNNNYRILSKTVKASELFSDGNSVHEYGYHPKEKTVKESIEFAYQDMISEYTDESN